MIFSFAILILLSYTTDSAFSRNRPLIDPQLQDLISRLLAKDPKQRIQMQEIKVKVITRIFSASLKWLFQVSVHLSVCMQGNFLNFCHL